MLIAFVAAALAAVSQATPVDRGSWFSPDDYPIDAAKHGIEGSVTFDLDIDATGKPTACRVTSSSGAQVLDQATCDLAIRRARFMPATGQDGKAVPARYSDQAVWQLRRVGQAQQTAAPREATTGSRLPVAREDLPFTRSVPEDMFAAPVTESDRESYAVAEKFGACLVKADPGTSMGFVMATPGSDTSAAARDKLKTLMSDCLGKSIDPYGAGEVYMSIKPTMVRGVIAEALYKLQLANRPQPAGQVSVAPILPASAANSSNLDDAILYDFAQCVTAAKATAVRSLVLSKIGSHDEQAAISELIPALSPCLYKGQTIKVDRPTLRSRLAEALYRWSVSAAQSR
jgi:TonB family protein